MATISQRLLSVNRKRLLADASPSHVGDEIASPSDFTDQGRTGPQGPGRGPARQASAEHEASSISRHLDTARQRIRRWAVVWDLRWIARETSASVLCEPNANATPRGLLPGRVPVAQGLALCKQRRDPLCRLLLQRWGGVTVFGSDNLGLWLTQTLRRTEIRATCSSHASQRRYVPLQAAAPRAPSEVPRASVERPRTAR